jgi:Short C-terminal domain
MALQRWQATYDAIEERYRFVLESVEKMKPWIFIPCFICCYMPAMATVSNENLNGWMNLVQSEQLYGTVGIQVSLARELYSSGGGSDHHMRNEIVGLKFDIGGDPTIPTPASSGRDGGHVVMAVPIAVVAQAKEEDVVSNLERLAQLYRNGALTLEEYESAKAKILR